MRTVSDGERAAASGYRNQYGVGAALVLNALRKHDFEWVRIADPEAGRVDDLQIARTARLDAYQVKWQQYPGTLTLNDLVRSRQATPPLIAQLADGWSRLRTRHPNRRIVVHLVTDAFASTSIGVLPEGRSSPTPYHFAAFVEQAWKLAKNAGQVSYDGEWGAVWRELQAFSGLDKEIFSSFVHDCALDLRTPASPEDEDHRVLADLLFSIAAAPERIVELDRTELLDRLGWRRRYEYRNPHEFDIPRFYRPIASTVSELSKRVDGLRGGYIGVVGPPGAGKSTLLTRTLRSLPIRLVRYYAYVPGAQDPNVRGESVNFLHDITLRLEEAGFDRGRRRPVPSDRLALLEKLHEQLQALGVDYEATGQKTVILVDGLDHIAREQRPERSLLADLPLPEQIPEGVYVVLGSQTTNLDYLPLSVHREVERPDRRVDMGRLSPADVGAIAAEVVPELDEKGRRRLFELSAGHPLALIYTIKRLQLAEDEEIQAAILAEAISYSDDIDAYYWSHWDRIQDDEALTHVLGLLARVRGSIGMTWGGRWIERSVAFKLERLFKPYFDVDTVNRWSFFHNSFRLFLQVRTVQPVLGQFPEERERAFHAELAKRYATAEPPWQWEALYHLYRADDHDGVVALATASWFREQAQALRPLEAILTDVRLAIRSAGILQDSLALVRLTLVAAALDQQKFILKDFALADRLLDLGDVLQALELVRDGDALRVEEEHALYLSVRLAEMGIVREGARLFELAEPYDMLFGRPLSNRLGMSRDTWDILKAWAEAAPRFRAPADVLSVIEQLVVEPEQHMEQSSEEATANLQRWLAVRAAVACAKRGAWSDWEKYTHWLDERKQRGLFETILRSAQSAVETEPERARELLRKLLEHYEPTPQDGESPHSIEDRLDVAELALFLHGDGKTVAAWVKDLPALPLQSNSSFHEERGLSQETRFRLYRLRYWLGEARDPDQLVAEDGASTAWGNYTKADEKVGLRQLALMVTTLAALWGRGRRGQPLSSSAFLLEVRWVLDMLQMASNGSTGLRLEVSASRPKVINFILQAAVEHNEEVVEALADELVRRWDSGEWPVALRRIATVALARVGAERRARELLTRIEGEMHGGGPKDRAEEHWEQANAWLELRHTNEARAQLRRMIVSSRGLLDDHDYQSEVWARWMGRANVQDPDNAEKRIRTMLRRLVAVSGEASGISNAAEELVAATFRWSPQRTVHLMKGLQEKGVLKHNEALSSLLRAALDAPDPPVNAVLYALTNLLIPLASPRTTRLVETLITSTAIRHSNDGAVANAHYLVERVRAEAISTDRQTWLKSIAQGLNQINVPSARVGIEAAELEDRERTSTSSFDSETLYLSDGDKVTLAEACQIVHSAAEFLRLVEREDTERTKYFQWTTVAEAATDRMVSIKDVSALANAIESKLHGREAAKVIARLSGRARELGQTVVAESLAAKAIAYSEPVGWDRWWDGGSRIEALRALQDADPDGGRVVAVKLYSEDVGGPFHSPQRLLVHFDEILPLLFDEIPELKIWTLLEDYLDELYASVPVEPVPDIEQAFSESVEDNAHDTAAQGVADAIATYLDHPSYVVAARAMSASAAVLLMGSETREMQRALMAAMARSEAATERVLVVLEALAKDKPDVLHLFREALHRLTESPNLAMRVNAAKLAALLAGTPVTVRYLKCDIPNIYLLELPTLAAHRTEAALDGLEVPAVLNDPARVLRPLDTEARVVAKEAGVDEDALLYRAVQFLNQLAQKHNWVTDQGSLDERRLNRFLDNTGLRVSFHKPHIEPAWQAIAHVAAELWDAGLLDVESAQQIVAMFFQHDPSLILVEPQPKPWWMPSIGSLSTDQHCYTVPDRWLERAEESLVHFRPRTPDGRVILGEFSRFAHLGTNERIEEDRTSHMIAVTERELWQEHALKRGILPFHRVFALSARDYVRVHAPSEHLVIAHTSYNVHTPAASWIAFNPSIARKLGWRLTSEGFFRWVDEAGHLAVESVWWTDGSLERHDSHQYCSVGEGWLVLVTESAYSRLIEQTSHYSRGGLVYRRRGFAASGGSAYAKIVLPLA